jgi:hypothetical protein
MRLDHPVIPLLGRLLMLAYSGPGKWVLGRRADAYASAKKA